MAKEGDWVIMVKIKGKKKIESWVFTTKQAAKDSQKKFLESGAVDCVSEPIPYKEKDWICRPKRR